MFVALFTKEVDVSMLILLDLFLIVNTKAMKASLAASEVKMTVSGVIGALKASVVAVLLLLFQRAQVREENAKEQQRSLRFFCVVFEDTLT